jgi:integrase/recombinase XerC
MPQGKQAKTISRTKERSILRHLQTTRHPERDAAMFLLSIKAGLRAKEISGLTWAMVTDAEGQIGDAIELENCASKGKSGRSLPMNSLLQDALKILQEQRGKNTKADWPVIYSERGRGLSAASVKEWFLRLYDSLGMTGCSSHSGHRTFITRAARKVSDVGGSMRDIQQLAGHSSLAATQRYIEGSSDAKQKLVQLI